MTSTLAPSKTTETTRVAAAATFTLVLVIAPPWLLISLTGAPWAWTLPDQARLDIALSWPIPSNTVKWTLVVLVWGAWVWLLARLAWETAAQLAGRRAASHVRSPVRFLAAALTGTITATAPAIAAAAAPDTVTTALAEVCETRPEDAESVPEDKTEPERDPQGDIIHTVSKNQTLWALADTYYNDPTQYPRIFRANEGILQDNGQTLTHPDWIYPGTKLTIPQTAPETADASPEPPATDQPEPDDGLQLPPEPEPDQTQTTAPQTTDEKTTATTPATDNAATPAYGRGTWITAGTFIAISTASAAIMMRRRRHPRPESEPSSLEKPSAPTAVATDDEPITGRLIELQDLLDEHHAGADQTVPEIPFATGTDEKPEVSALDHAGGGLGLTGPGATAATRAALWSAATAAATILIDSDTISHLGIDTEALMRIPGVRIAADAGGLAEVLAQAQSAVQYEPDMDQLYPQFIALFTDSRTAKSLPPRLLDEENTFAIILGPWESAWLKLAPDGTPLDGSLTEGPIDQLGHCYTLDKTTCNDLLKELTDTEPDQVHVPEPALPAEEQTDATPTAEPEPTPVDPAQPPNDQFELRLFGNHSLTWHNEEVHFGRNACIDMIAVFALNDWSLTRDELTEVVAPDATMSQAGDRRTSVVSEARAVFRDLTGDKTPKFIHYDRARARYRLEQDWFTTDLAAFDQHLQHSTEIDDPAERAQSLQAALRLYIGVLGEDLDEAWDLIDLRRRYQQTAYQLALDLAGLHQDADEPDRAAAVLERACAIDPGTADAWERLAALHRAQGDNAKADHISARAHHHRELARLTGRRPTP